MEEMTRELYAGGKLGHLKLFVQKVSPTKAPQIVGTLIDLGLDSQRICEIINPLGAAVFAQDATFVSRLIHECERRDQLAILQPWLQVSLNQLSLAQHA